MSGLATYNHRRTRRGSGGSRPLSWKNFRANSVFQGKAQVAKKSWMIKYISIQWKFSGQLVFFRQAQVAQKSCDKKYLCNTVNSGQTGQSASCSKILNDKIYFNAVKIFRATLFFRASASCSKILNVKLCSIQWKISGQTLFSGQAQTAQKSWMVDNILNTAENFRGNCFSGQGEKYFNSASKGNYRKVSCLGEHNTQGASLPWINKQGNYRICL